MLKDFLKISKENCNILTSSGFQVIKATLLGVCIKHNGCNLKGVPNSKWYIKIVQSSPEVTSSVRCSFIVIWVKDLE